MGNVSRSWMIVFRELGLTCKVGFGKKLLSFPKDCLDMYIYWANSR